MLTLSSARKKANDARKHADAALDELRALESRLRAGDATVTAAELAAAREEHGRRVLLAESAQGDIAKAERAERQQNLDSAVKSVAEVGAGWKSTLDTHAAAAVDHVAALLAFARTYNETADNAADTVRGISPEGMKLPEGVMTGNGAKGEHCTITRFPVHADELIGELLAAAYRKAGLLHAGTVVRVDQFGGDRVHNLVHAFALRKPKHIAGGTSE